MVPRRDSTGGSENGGQKADHIPVLLDAVLERLSPQAGACFIDATFGAGGYSRAILDSAPDVTVVALDRDPFAFAEGQKLVATYAGRLRLLQRPFSEFLRPDDAGDEVDEADEVARLLRPGTFDGVVFDLGVSSMQLDRPERGFSFRADGPLDMRMASPGAADIGSAVPALSQAPSAADVVNTFTEAQLADIFFQLGEEKRSRAIARAIVERRKTAAFERTLDLAGVVQGVLGGRRGEGKHPATRVFQALRIFVNDELGELVRGLAGAERLLKPGGRLVVVTFHSLEDRVVKRFFAQRSGKQAGASRHLPEGLADQGPAASFQIVNHRPLTSGKGETEANPRARSARLRSGVRTQAEPWPLAFSQLGLPGLVARGLD